MAKRTVELFMCIALVSATITFAQAATVGFWQFNEHAPGESATGDEGEIIDSSGNEHHGRVNGDPLPDYSEGPNDPTSAINLYRKDGSEDRVVVPHSTDFDMMLANGQDYTIEAIVKMQPGSGYTSAIMTKRLSAGTGWTFRTTNAGELSFYAEGTGLNFLYPEAHGSTIVTDNKWHHVAVQIDANANPALTTANFYVDHQLDATVAFTDCVYNGGNWVNENIANTSDVWIGDFINRWEDQFIGSMDALRFSTGLVNPTNFLPFTPEPPDPVPTIEHLGATNPTTEGFTLIDEDTTSTWSNASTTPASGRLQEVAGSVAYYKADVDSASFTHEDGWTVTAVMKLNENAASDMYNTLFAVEDGRDTWALQFLGGTGIDNEVCTSGSYSYEYGEWIKEDLDLTTDPTLGFHNYQIVYDPEGNGGNGSVTFYIDGLVAGTQTRELAGDTSLSRIFFGDNASDGSPASDSLWANVRLESGQHPIEPNLLPGDANNDGIVNESDAEILAENWLGSGDWFQGDFNGDGVINDADATILAVNWQMAASGTSVPEPGLIALLLSGLIGLLIVRHRS